MNRRANCVIVSMMDEYLLDPDFGFQRIKRLMAAGADWCELLVEDVATWRLLCEDQKTNVSNASRLGVGIYAVASGKSFHSCCDGVAAESIDRVTDAVCASLRRERGAGGSTSFSPFEVHAEPIQDVVEPVGGVDLSRKLEAVRAADSAGRQAHDSVHQLTIAYHDYVRRALILTSEGRIVRDERSMLELGVRAFLRVNGELLTAGEMFGALSGFEVLREAGRRPEDVAREAVRKAAVLIGAKPSPEGQMPVVFAPGNPGVLFHEACGHSFEADFVQKGSSFAGKMGQKVASELVTLIDSGQVFGSGGSIAFDDQGNPSQKTVLIDKGVLTSYIYDMRTALVDGVESTANGRCESYEHPPIPRMTNTYVENGTDAPDAILGDTKTGIYIKSIARGGNVDILSGNFVVGVGEGYAIEDGKLTFGLKNATISGDGPSVLMDIDAVGSDLEIRAGGRCGKGQNAPTGSGLPTLRVRKMVVGGGG
ncbi:MAG: TldD/PmbA family protein [Candidatus Coatesbacteria bacterium]|nr:TldD/PmbA family protein [Candidatus Coatesbacteria bacterium]